MSGPFKMLEVVYQLISWILRGATILRPHISDITLDSREAMQGSCFLL